MTFDFLLLRLATPSFVARISKLRSKPLFCADVLENRFSCVVVVKKKITAVFRSVQDAPLHKSLCFQTQGSVDTVVNSHSPLLLKLNFGAKQVSFLFPHVLFGR